MKHTMLIKQYIFTSLFVLLSFSMFAEKGETYHFTGAWDGNMIQIINPQEVGKKKFCVKKIYINGVKIKGNFKTGGIELNIADYGFSKNDDLLITMDCRSNCNPSFHSEGFILQQD